MESCFQDKQEKSRKKNIIEWSSNDVILSHYTASIDIEKRTDRNNDEMVLHKVPIQY